eukprot:1332537-Prymnesium_polylepis.1
MNAGNAPDLIKGDSEAVCRRWGLHITSSSPHEPRQMEPLSDISDSMGRTRASHLLSRTSWIMHQERGIGGTRGETPR